MLILYDTPIFVAPEEHELKDFKITSFDIGSQNIQDPSEMARLTPGYKPMMLKRGSKKLGTCNFPI